MAEAFGTDDLRVLSKYENAPQGAWTTMPQADKDSYLRIHTRLEAILEKTLAALPDAASFAGGLTLGFNPSGGVRGNRPKDLWCAIYPRDADVRMPQVYLIASHRGIELGYAAAIHPNDFSNQTFKNAVRMAAPHIFDALPEPSSPASQHLSEELARKRGWFYRRKTRLAPKENDFTNVEALLAFLKSSEGKSWGAGAISRYWLPHELVGDIDLAQQFVDAANLFRPLMVRVEAGNSDQSTTKPSPRIAPEVAKSDGIRGDIERFMEMYPERRSRPFATDQELWSVISGLQQRLKTLPAVASRPAIRVTWSVGQGNWARVP